MLWLHHLLVEEITWLRSRTPSASIPLSLRISLTLRWALRTLILECLRGLRPNCPDGTRGPEFECQTPMLQLRLRSTKGYAHGTLRRLPLLRSHRWPWLQLRPRHGLLLRSRCSHGLWRLLLWRAVRGRKCYHFVTIKMSYGLDKNTRIM